MKTRKVEPRSGIVLIAVLIVIVLLSLAAYQYTELMMAEFRAADSTVRAAQSRALAISGVHFAAAALADKNSYSTRLNSNPFDNESAFRGVLVREDDRPHFQGRFSLIAPPAVDDALGGGTTIRYGVTDESARININALVKLNPDKAHDMLMKLPNMTEEITDAIIDWIDTDEDQRPTGAENQYYMALTPGYRCKNGPLDSLEELLLVRGVTPELLFGTDKNHNGMQDQDEDGSNGFDPGWAAYLTVYSRDKNVDVDGNARSYLNETSDLTTYYKNLTTAVGKPLADFIILYRTVSDSPANASANTTSNCSQTDVDTTVQANLRGSARRSISSIYSLIGKSVSFRVGQGRQAQNRRLVSPLNDTSQQQQQLPTLLEKTTTKQDTELPAGINVISAPLSVLTCLTGLGSEADPVTDADIQAIISSRPTTGGYDISDLKYQTTAWLLTDAKLTASKLQAMEQYITSRTQTYRVQSLGYFEQGGPVTRVEAIIDTNAGSPRILYFRDLTTLGRGYEVPK